MTASAGKKIAKRGSTGIYSWYTYLTGFPFGKWLFNSLIGWVSPYTGSIPLKVQSLTPGHCTTSMTERRSILNPFKSIHAAALVNMGEATGGFAVLSWVETNEQPLRAIPTRIEADYYKKARGEIIGVCNFKYENEITSKTQVQVVTDLLDSTGSLVAKITAYWTVDLSPSKKDE